MARMSKIAGVIGIASIIVPWTIMYLSLFRTFFISFNWIILTIAIGLMRGRITHLDFLFVNSFPFVDAALSVIGLIFILAGSVILIVSRNHPRIGGIFLLVGSAIVIIDYLYDEAKYGRFSFIPIGMVLGIIGGIIGTIAKPEKWEAKNENDDAIEKILKLKRLLDAGIITKEEFEAQKNKIMHGSSSDPVEQKLKDLKALLDSGAISQSEYEQQKSKILRGI